MGFLDKVADFLDDGKINGSADKSKFGSGNNAAQPAPAPAPAPAQAGMPAGNTQKSPEEIRREAEAVQAQTIAQMNAVPVEPGKRTSIKYGTPEAIPCIFSDGSFGVRAHGIIEVTAKTAGYTVDTLTELVTAKVNVLIPQALQAVGTADIPSNMVHAKGYGVSDYIKANFSDETVEITNIMLMYNRQ